MVEVIPNHNYTKREQTVIDILINSKIDIKSFINVGFHSWHEPRRHWWRNICIKNNIDWKIVEVYKPNVEDSIEKGCPRNKIFNLSIIDVEKLPLADCLFFWHGPEHINKNDFLKVLPKIEKKYKLLIFGMPLGHEPQGDAYGNPYERHISSWNSLEWKSLSYSTIEVYDRQQYPHITVYKECI